MNNPRYDDPKNPARDPQKQGETIRPGQREDQHQQGGTQPGQQGNTPDVRRPGQKDDRHNEQQR